MITKVATIVFFAAIGISLFVAIPYIGWVIGISALVAAVGLIIGK